MYLKIIILAIIFSLSLGETSSRNFLNSAMQISDALPVQFWLTGCATFNEHFAPGVHHKCYCAPWECDDEIKIQFKDDPSQNFSLEVYDIEEQLLATFPFDEVLVGVYEFDLNLAEDSPDVCDQLIKLKIKRNQGLQGITLPALNTWSSVLIDAGDVAWTIAASPNVTLPGNGPFPPNSQKSEILFVDYAFIPGVTYNITFNRTRTHHSGSSNPRTSTLMILDSSNNVQFFENHGDDPGVNSTLISFIATSDCTRIGFKHNSGSNVTINADSVTGQRTVGDAETVAHTDCLDIRQNHEQSILLTYSNHRNFAGLVYDNSSPEVEFNIRIPAIFYHQRFPEEDEVMELSNELVTLNGTVRKQRLLDIDYIPYYFHEKLKLILKHQLLTVFNKQWVKQEVYEITEGNRQGPLKKAKCWISEKDFVHRNVL